VKKTTFISIKIALYLLILLTGCHRVQIDKEFSRVQNIAQELTGCTVYWPEASDNHTKSACNELASGISRNQAISIALANNLTLQADFESLGVAKADLEQAGLYQNPQADTFVWPPLRGKTVGAEVDATLFSIADLWQVPLRKRVEQEVLEATTFRIVEAILNTVAETREAYDKILFANALLKTTKGILKENELLQKQISYYQQFGLVTDLEKHLAQVNVGLTEQQLLDCQDQLRQAYVALKRVLGHEPNPEPLTVTDTFEGFIFEVVPLEELQAWALMYRPEILSARATVKRYQHAVTLEKARVFKTVSVGATFKQEFDGSRGIGPLLGLEIPLFDTNYAQIAKAQFLVAQAKIALAAAHLKVKEEVQRAYIHLAILRDKIKTYKKNIIPPNEQAIAYAKRYHSLMQITMPVLIQTQRFLLEQRRGYLYIYHEALNAWTHLERAVGKRLPTKQSTISI
jgi:outer membrane protein, heavy metal efflux system